MELKTDLPSFLLPRMLERWRSKNANNLQERERRWEKLRITLSIGLEGKNQGNMGIRYQFTTSDNGNWQLFLGNRPSLSPSQTPLDLTPLLNELYIIKTTVSSTTKYKSTK